MTNGTNQGANHVSPALLNLPLTHAEKNKFKLFSKRKELGDKCKLTFDKRLLLLLENQ